MRTVEKTVHKMHTSAVFTLFTDEGGLPLVGAVCTIVWWVSVQNAGAGTRSNRLFWGKVWLMYVKARVMSSELRKSRPEYATVWFPGYPAYCLVVFRAWQACSVLASVVAVVTELCPWTLVSRPVIFVLFQGDLSIIWLLLYMCILFLVFYAHSSIFMMNHSHGIYSDFRC